MVVSTAAGPVRAVPPEPPVQLAPVVVTGTRTRQQADDAPTPVTVIDREELTRIGAQSAADALQSVEGVTLQRSFRGATAELDGLSARHTLVLVDGRRVAGATDGQIDLSRFPVEHIERIEVLRGPASTLYGSDAMGGVIHIITRQPDRPWQLELHGQYGTLNTGDASVFAGLRQGAWSATIRGGYHRVDAFDLNPADAATTGSAHESGQVSGEVAVEYAPGGRLSAGGSYWQRDSQGIDSSATGAVFDRRSLSESATATLSLTQGLAGGGRLELRGGYELFRDQYHSDQRGSAALDAYEESRQHLVDASAQLDWLLPASHLLTVGVDALYETLASPRLDGGRGERVRGAVFAQNEWTALEEPLLVVLPGVRVDFDSQFGAYATPRLTVRVDPVETLSLSGTVGLGYRAPAFKDLYLMFENPGAGYVVQGNPDLRPERSLGGTLDVSWQALPWLRLSAHGFYQSIEDLIDFQQLPRTDAGPDRYVNANVASAVSRGVSGSVTAEAGPWLTVRLSYTFADVRDLTLDRRVAGRPTHRGDADLVARYRPYGLSLSVRGSVVGPRSDYEDLDGDGEAEASRDLDPYGLLGITLGWQAHRTVDLYVAADNLLGAGHHDDLPLQPLTVRGGVTVRL